jgi:TfoX/Sxy family transcriptional regulator of competence genes
MATSQDFIDYILDCLGNNKNITTKKMFGEYALYFDKKVVAFVCDNTFFLKINEKVEAELSHLKLKLKTGHAYPGSKDYYIVGEDIFENKKVFLGLLEKCSLNVIAKKKKQSVVK